MDLTQSSPATEITNSSQVVWNNHYGEDSHPLTGAEWIMRWSQKGSWQEGWEVMVMGRGGLEDHQESVITLHSG